MKHFISILLLTFFITGCVSTKTLVDGVLGRYPHYDALEYDRAVQVEIIAKDLEVHSNRLDELITNIEALKLYVAGRPYNERISKQVELLDKVVKELQLREQKGITISKAYYKIKWEDIVKLSDNIRKSIGIEKL